MDRENVLSGDSMLALCQWMRDNGIQFVMQQDEPEDHLGLLLLLMAWLAENEHCTEREQLLAWHLFPWSSRPPNMLVEKVDHPFYQVSGKSVRLMLAQQ